MHAKKSTWITNPSKIRGLVYRMQNEISLVQLWRKKERIASSKKPKAFFSRPDHLLASESNRISVLLAGFTASRVKLISEERTCIIFNRIAHHFSSVNLKSAAAQKNPCRQADTGTEFFIFYLFPDGLCLFQAGSSKEAIHIQSVFSFKPLYCCYGLITINAIYSKIPVTPI